MVPSEKEIWHCSYMMKLNSLKILTKLLIPTIILSLASSLPIATAVAAVTSGFPQVPQKRPDLPLDHLTMPPGFEISIFAVAPHARSLALGKTGEVFVGTSTNKVYRLNDPKMSGVAESVDILLDGKNQPNGVAYKNGTLYVAEVSQITRYRKIDQKTARTLKGEVLAQRFPKDKWHGLKFIRFGPDDQLYVPVGANCNICEPKKDQAKIYRIDVNSKGKSKEVVATGVRNTVGFDWDPKNKVLWFTDNGRDELGDNLPPDEINKAAKNGQDFGFPYCFGQSVSDPKFHKTCPQSIPAQLDLPAHIAPLGMRFYSQSLFPRTFQNQILVAEHGSSSQTKPQGYRVSQILIKAGDALLYQPWIEGWLGSEKSEKPGEVWGRPVDVENYFDGSVLISDDLAGVVYRVTYHEPK